MLKRMFFASLVMASFSGCLLEQRRQQRPVQPTYVAQCPDGYRYDGHDCHPREQPRREGEVIRVEVR